MNIDKTPTRARRSSVEHEEEQLWIGFYRRIGADHGLASELLVQLDNDPQMKRTHLALYVWCMNCMQLNKDRQARNRRIGQFVRRIHDRYVGASLRLIQAMGLRRKESVQFRPFVHVVPFETTGLPAHAREADRYVRTRGKGGRVRYVPLDSPIRIAAVEFALGIVRNQDDHIGDPTRDLKQNLRRFDHVMEKFGITIRERGATVHGLRHEVMNNHFEAITGEPSPVRGGARVTEEIDRLARIKISHLAGHARIRAAGAYIGSRTRQPQSNNSPQSSEATTLATDGQASLTSPQSMAAPQPE